jgi:Oxidoreductase family, NAD-binding Rossmann fold
MATERGPAIGTVVVGTGFGCLTHVRAFRAAGFEVLALVGRDPDRAAERAKRFEIPHALTSLAAAVSLPGVEAVTIATPPLSHAPLALEAIAAGKHVVCEKPFARDAPQGREVRDAAEAAGVVHNARGGVPVGRGGRLALYRQPHEAPAAVRRAGMSIRNPFRRRSCVDETGVDGRQRWSRVITAGDTSPTCKTASRPVSVCQKAP